VNLPAPSAPGKAIVFEIVVSLVEEVLVFLFPVLQAKMNTNENTIKAL